MEWVKKAFKLAELIPFVEDLEAKITKLLVVPEIERTFNLEHLLNTQVSPASHVNENMPTGSKATCSSSCFVLADHEESMSGAMAIMKNEGMPPVALKAEAFEPKAKNSALKKRKPFEIIVLDLKSLDFADALGKLGSLTQIVSWSPSMLRDCGLRLRMRR